jgi:uncharacterized membrane protein YdbT with pleckstrin-like domain
LDRLLRSDEKVLWSGKPARMPFVLSSFATIPFGLIFMGFSVFWMMMASQAGGPFWLFGLIAFFAGLWMSLGVPLRQLVAYRNTEYSITDQRIITQTGAIGLDTRYLDLNKIQEVYVQVGFIDKMFGTGTIFASTASYVNVGRGGALTRPSLAALKEPYEVHNILQEAIAKARHPRD